MPLSNAAKNAIQAYGKKKFPYQPQEVPGVDTGFSFSGDQSQPSTPVKPANGRQSRILMTMQPEPVRDVQEEDRLRRIAGVNAIGRALGSVAQLGGMAAGGDATYIEDNVSPFVMDKMNYLDNDYRNQLQDHYRRAFAVDTFNTNQQNQDIDDQNRYDDQMEQIQVRGENARQLAEQKAQIKLQELQSKSALEQRAEMEAVGINPDDKDAYAKYLQSMRGQLGVNQNYRKSLTAENYANANKLNNPKSTGAEQEFDLPTLKSGKDAFIRDIDKQLEGLNPRTDAEKIKTLMEQREFYQTYNPGKNKLLDSEIMQRGIRETEGKDSNGDFTQKSGKGQPYTPGQGFDFDSRINAQTPTESSKVTQGLQQGFRDIATGNFDNIDQTIQYIIQIGDAANEEEAEKIIEDYIQELTNNQ